MKFEGSRNAILAVFFSILAAASLSWCIYRDLRIEKMYPGDLRNRIVGSRMQTDGKSPYFYHFHQDPNLRYFDWSNDSRTEKNSNATATPFFHFLISPVANYQDRTISKIWLFAEYTTLFSLMLVAFSFCRTKQQKFAVATITLLFLYTNAWINHIAVGQMYLFIAAEAMLLFTLLRIPRQHIMIAALAGIVAAALVLTRPTTIVFVCAFSLIANQYRRNYLVTMGSAFAVTVMLSFSTANSRFFWKDYKAAIAYHIDHHQGINRDVQNYPVMYNPQNFEGWNKQEMKEAALFKGFVDNDANGNVFVFLKHGIGFAPLPWMLGVMCLAAMLLIYFLLVQSNRLPWHAGILRGNSGKIDLYSASLLGFICYMMTDLFSPIHRFHYNAIQWIFPLLLVASKWKPQSQKFFAFLAVTGLLLNSISKVMFPMQQCIGEYIIAGALMGFLFTYKPSGNL